MAAIQPWLIGGAVLLLGAAALWGLWWLWWRLPKREAERLRRVIRDPKARADVEDNFRKTIGQLIGGAAVLLGAGVAYYQTQVTGHEAELSRREAELSRQAADLQSERSVQAARALLISQQVSKGFEDLGSADTLVVLGGIYALEGVMQDPDSQYRLPALEGLCGFVRERTKDRTPPPDASKATRQEPATDLRAALTVIGRRPRDLAGRADLSGVRLWRMNLVGVALAKIDLQGAHLEGADLDHADLEGANLFRAHLEGATLAGARLVGTTLLGADLEDTSLEDADLDRANLAAANLRDADLQGAILDRSDMLAAVGVTQAQLDRACGTGSMLPDAAPVLKLKRCPLPPPALDFRDH